MSDYTIYAATVKQVADLQAQISTQIEMLAACRDARYDMQAEVKQLQSEVARLRAALEAVEFVSDDDGRREICPWCKAAYGWCGHRPDCKRQIALGIATT